MTAMTWADRLRALYRGNNFLSPGSYNELADHIDELAAKVESLRKSHEWLDGVGVNLRESGDLARAEAASLRRIVAEVEALTKDTDGGDVDGDAEIPIGEIRRALAEVAAR